MTFTTAGRSYRDNPLAGSRVRVLWLVSYQVRGSFLKGGWVLFAVVAVQVSLLSGVAHAAGASFFDGFDTFDGSRWTKGDHNLGRSYLNPANVDVAEGNARFKIPARTLQGPSCDPTSSTTTGPTPRG